MSKTLLEQAKGFVRANKTVEQISRDHFDLAIAFVKGEVNCSQIAKVLGKEPSHTYVLISRSLREAFSRGELDIKLKGE